MTEENGSAITEEQSKAIEEKIEKVQQQQTSGKWVYVDKYLTNLRGDIYGQPTDHSHTAWAIDAMSGMIPTGTASVLDVGCGHGFLRATFENVGIQWSGVTLGPDYEVCHQAGMAVYEADQTFLPFEDKTFDLIFARHILEHSPMPILTLMEWRRVSSKYLLLISPAPDWWGYRGKNHYSIAPKEQIRWWLERSGWRVLHEEVMNTSSGIFLHHWREELVNAGHLDPNKANTHFPAESKNVEYRFLCKRGEEVLS